MTATDSRNKVTTIVNTVFTRSLLIYSKSQGNTSPPEPQIKTGLFHRKTLLETHTVHLNEVHSSLFIGSLNYQPQTLTCIFS